MCRPMEKETEQEQRQKLQVPEYVQKVPDSSDWKICTYNIKRVNRFQTIKGYENKFILSYTSTKFILNLN